MKNSAEAGIVMKVMTVAKRSMSEKYGALSRFFAEYGALSRILEMRDILALAKATVIQSPAILRTKRLTALDASMSRNMTVRFGNSPMVMPLADVDRMLVNDNPTFGNVREIYARNCYLEHLKLKKPVSTVLDLGANRGMFSLLALLALDADIAVGVEPMVVYDSVHQLLLKANGCDPLRAPRYRKFITSPSAERLDPSQNVSIETILREQKIDRFRLVKMDIEGHEKTVFSEPEWLAHVDNITMELHPHFVDDLSLIPRALDRCGFKWRIFDQAGNISDIQKGMFLCASHTGELA